MPIVGVFEQSPKITNQEPRPCLLPRHFRYSGGLGRFDCIRRWTPIRFKSLFMRQAVTKKVGRLHPEVLKRPPVLRKFADLTVVGALLIVNAVLSFMQEHRAAGAVGALQRQLQVSARVLREAKWQVIPRESPVSYADSCPRLSTQDRTSGFESRLAGLGSQTRDGATLYSGFLFKWISFQKSQVCAPVIESTIGEIATLISSLP